MVMFSTVNLLNILLVTSIVVSAGRKKKWKRKKKHKHTTPAPITQVMSLATTILQAEFDVGSLGWKMAAILGNIQDEDMNPDYLGQMKNFVNASLTSSSEKATGKSNLGINTDKALIPLPLQAIWGYGCWCNFGASLMTGSGEPVNFLDGFCKNMQLCLKCGVIDSKNCPDAENNFEVCDPKTQDYAAEFSKLPSAESILADCTDLNAGNECAINSCCCELKLIADIISLITSSQVFDPNYKHSLGSFNPNESCGPNTPNGYGNGSNKDCCGEYPFRFPYKTNKMNCCIEDDTIYNPMMYTCCPFGVGVQTLGSCP